MADNNFEIIGLDDFIRDLEAMGKDGVKDMKPYVNQAGEALLKKVKQKVSVDTGKLKESLYLKRSVSKKTIIRNTLTWGKDVGDYAAPLELGHGLVYMGKRTLKYVKARPFLRPAADENKENLFRIMIEGINKVLEKFGD